MNTPDWTELERILAEACELGPDERRAGCRQRCPAGGVDP
jgi:hypothetical protein